MKPGGPTMRRAFSKFVITAIVTLMASGAANAFQESVTLTGYLPPLTPWGGTHSGPSYVLCPEPWTRMVSVTDGSMYSEAWHCVPLNHSCFTTHGQTQGFGCGGGGVSGWKVTAPAPAVPVSYDQILAEVEQMVITPCLRAIVRHGGGVEGLTEDEVIELSRSMSGDTWDATAENLAGIVQGQGEDARALLYQFGLSQCIASGTQ